MENEEKPNRTINSMYGINRHTVMRFHRFKNSEIMDACERVFGERKKGEEKNNE